MSKLATNSVPAERQRGLIFAENFNSVSDVILNGATVNGSPAFANNIGTFRTISTVEYLDYGAYTCDFTTNDFTVMFWCKNLTQSNESEIVGKRNWSTAAEAGWSVGRDYGADGAWIHYADGSNYIDALIGSDYDIDNNPEWVHICVVFNNGGNAEIFANGVSKGTVDISSVGSVTTTAKFCIMGNTNSARCTSGNIKDVRVFNTALTDQEILDYANNETFNYMNDTLINLPMRMEDHALDGSTGDELLTNGDFANGLDDWTISSGLASVSDGVCSIARNGESSPQITGTPLTTVNGATYRVELDLISASHQLSVYIAGGENVVYSSSTGNLGNNSFTFTAASTSTTFAMGGTGSGSATASFRNVSVKRVYPLTRDVSGNANDVVLGDGSTSSTYPTKLTKKGYSFDNTNQYMSLTTPTQNNFNGSTSFSISAWIKSTGHSPSGTDDPIITLGYGYAANTGTLFTVSCADARSGYLTFTQGINTNSVSSAARNIMLYTGIWYHVVAVCDVTAGTMSIYANGVNIGTANIVTPVNVASATSNISLRADATERKFEGTISNLTVYNEALTPIQVLDLHTKLKNKINQV